MRHKALNRERTGGNGRSLFDPGVARGASEADIKKAYRKLAKELHPGPNKDNPKATERFSKVTQAYDILTDKDKRAQYDRGEIDEDGNPRMPFGFGGGGGGGRGTRFSRAQWRAVRVQRRRRGGGSLRPVRRPVRRLGRRGGRRRAAAIRSAASAGAARRRRRAPDVAYRLEVLVRGCGEARRPARHARQRQDARHQAARRGRGRRQDPSRRPGPGGAGRPWRRDRHHRDQAAPLLPAARATISGSICR